MRDANAGWIRFGILALPASGLLLGIGNIVRGFALGIVVPAGQTGEGGLAYGSPSNLDPAANPEGFAAAFGSAGYAVGTLTIVAGLVVSVFGLLALFAHLGAGPGRRWALVALVPSVLGSALILPVFGVLAFALPALARAYSGGSRGPRFGRARHGRPALGRMGVGGGCALRRGERSLRRGSVEARSLPRWSAVPYALPTPLLVVPSGGDGASLSLGFLGLALMVGGTGWIAAGVRQEGAKEGDAGRRRVR